jgi:Mn2+/Fe2+ NRAMP family transporter
MGKDTEGAPAQRAPWWKSIGPALITACVVFGPGSLLISSNVGAKYGYELVWLLLLTGLMMGTYLTMGARIGVCGGATPCTLVARRLGRPAAAVIALTLCLIATAFQFSNNLAVALAAGAFLPEKAVPWIVVGFNAAVILFLFLARHVYSFLERGMKVMVGVILACFVFNLVAAKPDIIAVIQGFWPSLPEGIELGLPKRTEGAIVDPMILVAGLLGTTFSVAGAFFQGNLVRERNWTVKDYEGSVGDAIAGVCVLTGVSMIIMVTAGTVIPGQPATDIGTLALSLRPLLGSTAYWVFCIGLVAVAMNPFLINAMIGGTILADGIGTDARMSDRWPRILTVGVMLVGMGVALWALSTGEKPIRLIIFGQALTVLGNPLMAISMLWLANNKDVMGDRRNGWVANILGGIGLMMVLLMALRVLWRIVLQVT